MITYFLILFTCVGNLIWLISEFEWNYLCSSKPHKTWGLITFASNIPVAQPTRVPLSTVPKPEYRNTGQGFYMGASSLPFPVGP